MRVIALLIGMAMAGLLPSAPAGAVPTVAYLGFLGEQAPKSALYDAFLTGMRDQGYAPGRNLRLEIRRWTTDEELRRHVAEMTRAKVDVIFVGPPAAAMTAREVTREIPVVCASCGDPVENGLARSLARPEGNVTGLASLSAELIGKRFQLVRELLPQASRVAVLVFPANPGTPQTLKALEAVGSRLRIDIQKLEVRRREDLAGAFKAAVAGKASAIVVQDDPLVRFAAPDIARLGVAHAMPVVAGLPETAVAGALMSYGPDRLDMTRRAATWVRRILDGAKPGDLPFEQAETLELIINLKTSRAIGLKLPETLVARANRLIY